MDVENLTPGGDGIRLTLEPVLHQAGLHEAGADGVHADPVPRLVEREVPGETEQARLGRRVREHARGGQERVDGRDVDD
jgi:hypothetical protein